MTAAWLAGDGITYGGWCGIPSSFSTELMGYAGFDWLCIDLQHGLVEMEHVLPMLQAASVTRTPCMVRVAANDPAQIMKVLDTGAAGVIVPMVNSAADAARAVSACRYPPAGIRSWGPNRAQLAVGDYTAERANAETVCAVMIETVEALDVLDEILSVPGIDVAFVGPSDLATTMALAPRIGPITGRHSDAVAAVAASCREHRILPGIYCGNAAATLAYREMGYRFLAASSDVLLLRHGTQALLDQLRT